MPEAINYWNIPEAPYTVALGNSGSGTNNIDSDGTKAKLIYTAHTGTYGSRVNVINIIPTVGGLDGLQLWVSNQSASPNPPLFQIPFDRRVTIVFDDGESNLVSANPLLPVAHMPKFVVQSGASVYASHVNNATNLWVITFAASGDA